ncbi:MAG TPA: hypothetical protein VGX78_14620, partial [Pirellulales bacterium]|nr:hypothetical protein [Pirellulales bacterium]
MATSRNAERALLTAVAMLALVCLAAAGCASKTHHVAMQGRVTTEMPPQPGVGPVVPMSVPRGAADGPSVALIDVDGLLLDSNCTGLSSFGENPVSLFRERLDAAAADPCVRAIVVRINSPG